MSAARLFLWQADLAACCTLLACLHAATAPPPRRLAAVLIVVTCGASLLGTLALAVAAL